MSNLFRAAPRRFFGVRECCESVAEGFRHSDDLTATTIRCAINDRFDMAAKDGYDVPEDYDQTRAVQTVRRLVAQFEPRASWA